MEYVGDGVELVSLAMLAPLTVKKKNSTLAVVTRESLLKRANADHANGATFARINQFLEDLTYNCEDYGLENGLTDEDRNNYESDFDAESGAVEHIRQKLMIEKEIRANTLLWNTSTWTGSALFTDNSGAPWDAAGSDIIGQVIAASEKVRINSGLMPDTLQIGAATMPNILKNTGIKARFPGAMVITKDMIVANLAAIFGLKRLVVGEQVYDSADEGQTFSGTDIWTDDYAMVARTATPNAPLWMPSVGRSPYWDAMNPAPGETPVIPITEYREEQTESDIFRGREFVDEFLCDKYFAQLMKIDVI